MAIEPGFSSYSLWFSLETPVSRKWQQSSCASSTSTCSTSCNDFEEDDQHDSGQQVEVKLFVSLKKISAKNHVGEAVALLKTIVENYPSK